MTTAERSPVHPDYLSLLRPGGHGAVAATRGAVPVLFPVAFELAGNRIVFELSNPDELDPKLDGAVVAFGAADVDGATGRQWHVHVLGVARGIVDGSVELEGRPRPARWPAPRRRR